jgi:hypothetical protein
MENSEVRAMRSLVLIAAIVLAWVAGMVPTVVLAGDHHVSAYSIQTVGSSTGDQSLSVFPSVLGLTDSGTVMMNGPAGCWVSRQKQVPCAGIASTGYQVVRTNLHDDYLLRRVLYKHGQEDSLAVSHWTGTRFDLHALPLPKGLVNLELQGVLLLTNGDAIASLIPNHKWEAAAGQYIWIRLSDGSYTTARHLRPPGITDPYLIDSAAVAFGHVVISGRLHGPLRSGAAFLWQLSPRGSRIHVGIPCFKGVGFQTVDGQTYEAGYTRQAGPHLFFTAPLQVSKSGRIWAGPRRVWAYLGKIIDPFLTPADSSGNPVLLFARQVWMNMDGPSYLYQDDQSHSLSQLIPPESGWSYLAGVARIASGRIAGVGTYKGQNYAFLMSPSA